MTFKASGNVFYSSNAATFSNVFISSGTVSIGDGFQGTVAGYDIGGNDTPGSPSKNQIQKYSFAVDSNSTDVADITVAKWWFSAHASQSHGYTAGGYASPSNPLNTIDKFPFASNTNATDVGDLINVRQRHSGVSSGNHGYTAMGTGIPITPTANLNRIERFPFATDSSGSVTIPTAQPVQLTHAVGHSYTTHGYVTTGAYAPPGSFNPKAFKFPFASESFINGAGNLSLTLARLYAISASSTTHGYTSGGLAPGAPISNTIDKFPFATDTNATDVGDLAQEKREGSGSSSTTHGYVAGGRFNTGFISFTNTIQKFPFASDTNSTDIADLITNGMYTSGTQD